MCLLTIQIKPKWSVFPKFCYKVLVKDNNQYGTPYQGTEVHPRVLKVFIANKLQEFSINSQVRLGIHTFAHLKDAKGEAHLFNGGVFLALIPPFTKFYSGTDVAFDSSFCSKRILFLFKIKKF